jgi:DNA repair exonuclease SbcCD ATPase subunit
MQIYIPMLQESINSKLKGISNFSIKIDTERSKRDGTTNDGLEIKVIHESDNTEDDIGSLSGGQKTLLRLAFILSVSEILKKRTGDTIDFLALDEAIIGLDEETEVKACEILEREIQSTKNMFVISHSKNVQNLFSSFLQVKNNNGTSTIHFTPTL